MMLAKVPRYVKEILVSVLVYGALLALWEFAIRENIVVSDQALSTIGLALSAALGVLTAVVVSFVLMTWQLSRQERSTAYWRWCDYLNRLIDSVSADAAYMESIADDVAQFILEASSAALVTPMPRDRCAEPSTRMVRTIGEDTAGIADSSNPSHEDMEKARVGAEMSRHLLHLATGNLEHRMSHYLYRRVLSLRRLMYHLLVALAAAILVVVAGTVVTVGIPDILNGPLVVTLLIWVLHVLVQLGREIKRVSGLEDDLRRQEETSVGEPFPQLGEMLAANEAREESEASADE